MEIGWAYTLWALVFVVTVGDSEPRIAVQPNHTFTSKEQCEKVLMTYLSDGYVMSMNSSEQLVISHEFAGVDEVASCVMLMEPE